MLTTLLTIIAGAAEPLVLFLIVAIFIPDAFRH
jgi:hypothetical protein